jgi:hypothetical protein
METFLDRKDPRLLLNNHLLFKIAKQEFISSAPQAVYEARVIPEEGGLAEVEYIAHPGPSNGRFLREGLRPSGSRSVLLAFKSLRQETSAEERLASTDEKLETESAAATELLRGKVVATVVRLRESEVLLNFGDGTRLYVDSGTAVEFSVTDRDTDSESAG